MAATDEPPVSFEPLLSKLASVDELSDDEKQAGIALCRDVRTVQRRTDIISQGAAQEHIHLVLEGWAARYTLLPNGSRRITAFMLPGDFCDIHGTVLAHTDHSIAAITDCQVAFIDHAEMERITRLTPVLTRAFWRSTLIDEAVLRQWLVSSGRRDALERIAHLLCELHVRLRLVGLVDHDRFRLPLIQEEIGDATGLTPVHVNRVVKRLRGNGLLAIGNGYLEILDVPALRRAAQFHPDYLHLSRADSRP